MAEKKYVSDNPELLAEWDYEKNSEMGLFPDCITLGSGKKAWWICSEGHKYQSIISNRTKKNHGCPFCSGHKVLVGFNDLSTINPQLALEWDYEKNQINPQDVTTWSHKKVWWRCEKAHHYEKSVAERSRGDSCPFCSNHRVLKGFNDLSTEFPEIANEWNYERNEKKPEEYIYGSKFKAWWRCSNGHEYMASIVSRTFNGTGCPYCSSQIPLKGVNDLQTTNPELVKEWDYNKNGELFPRDFLPGSHKKVWWKCSKCGHSWNAQIKTRNKGYGCPICGRKKALINKAMPKEGQSFADLCPDLIQEWDYSMNKDIDPYSVKPNSTKKVYWKCNRGHVWKAEINRRAKQNHGCPQCHGLDKTSFPEQAIFFYLEQLFIAKNRELVDGLEFDIYLPEERIAVEYDGVFWHQSNHSIRMEERKNSYCNVNGITLFRIKETIEKNQTINAVSNIITYRYDTGYTLLNDAITILLSKISARTGKNISITPDVESDRSSILLNYEQAEYESSLMQYPELVAEWDYEKNAGLKPQNVRPGSEQKVYWICKKGHKYFSRISHRVNGSGCPYCSGKKVMPGENDLETQNPELAADWNYDKNGELFPSHVTFSSTKKVWWKCPCGHEWQATINSRKNGNGCPVCSGRKHPKIFCFENKKTYDTFVAIKKDLGVDNSKVSMVVKGKRKSTGGYHFKYLDEKKESTE